MTKVHDNTADALAARDERRRRRELHADIVQQLGDLLGLTREAGQARGAELAASGLRDAASTAFVEGNDDDARLLRFMANEIHDADADHAGELLRDAVKLERALRAVLRAELAP